MLGSFMIGNHGQRRFSTTVEQFNYDLKRMFEHYKKDTGVKAVSEQDRVQGIETMFSMIMDIPDFMCYFE